MRKALQIGCAIVATSLLACSAAQAQTQQRDVELRVGQTKRLATFGAHGLDCLTSVPPDALITVAAPRLGTLSQHEGAPYQPGHSLSNTCAGAKLMGTEVDYTARAAGTDTVGIDARFRNGTAHWIFTVKVDP